MKNLKFTIFLLTGFLLGCDQKPSIPETTEVKTNTEESMFVFSITPEEETDNSSNKGLISDSLVSLANTAKYINTCDGVFSVVYQKLSLKTDKEYLEKLNYLYEATSQQDLQNRRSSSLGISVPDYGTLSWGSNKSKVKSVFNKYRTQVDYSLSYNEHIELSETYTRSEDVENALKAWTDCIRITNNIPYLQLQEQSDSSAIVFFQMMPNLWREANDKVKVKDITFSENLILTKGDIKGRKIKYSSRNALTFKRKNLEKASIIVDLDEGFNVIPINIPSRKKIAVIETRIVKDVYQCNVEIDLPANWMKITLPNGEVQPTITFPNQRSPYKINFKIKTTLKNVDAFIEDCFYTSTTGLADFKNNGVKLEKDGTLSIDCFLATSQRYMTGKITILYGIKKEVCVANCPE